MKAPIHYEGGRGLKGYYNKFKKYRADLKSNSVTLLYDARNMILVIGSLTGGLQTYEKVYRFLHDYYSSVLKEMTKYNLINTFIKGCIFEYDSKGGAIMNLRKVDTSKCIKIGLWN